MKLPPWLWRICRSKWSKRCLIASPFLLMAGIVGFYGIANWWGARALRLEITAMKADGLPTTFEELFGPGPPAEGDVFQHPALARQLGKAGSKDGLQFLEMMSIPGLKQGASWRGEPDVAKLSDARLLSDPVRPAEDEAIVARDLLRLIEPQSREFDACAEGLSRPVIHWGSGSEDQRFRCMTFHRLLRFTLDRARLRLAAGQAGAAAAAADVNTALTLCDGFDAPRSGLLAFYCRAFGERSTAEVVWEGLRRGSWTETQLAGFQARLQRVDLHRMLCDAVPTELNYYKQVLERFSPVDLSGKSWPAIGVDFRECVFAPNWSRIEDLAAESWKKIRPLGLSVEEYVEQMRVWHAWHMRFRDSGRLPEVRDFEEWETIEGGKHLYRGIQRIDTRRRLTLCGIALERYRLKYGKSPERLDELVPEFLSEVPKDICDGQPLRYQILPDGGVHVWSIWPSGKDEGGTPRSTQSSKNGNDVWTTGRIPGLTEADYDTK